MSSSVAKGNGGVVSSLQGPRPLPLSLPGSTTSSPPPPRPAKRPRVGKGGDDVRAPPVGTGPVIVYENTPKVIHARPDEFKALVQRLTGRQPTDDGTAGDGGDQVHKEAVFLPAGLPSSSQHMQDPLVLTLGQQQVVQLPPPLPLNDYQYHYTPPVLPPSPSGASDDFLLSPGSFLFSPTTMQTIHELIS